MITSLFVNSERDLDAIISIGYNKPPLLDMYESKYDYINEYSDAFKQYYQGLISFYRIGGENLKMMPTVKYSFVPIITADKLNKLPSLDPFLINTRTFGSKEKVFFIQITSIPES